MKAERRWKNTHSYGGVWLRSPWLVFVEIEPTTVVTAVAKRHDTSDKATNY